MNANPATQRSVATRIREAGQDTMTVAWRDMVRTARQPEMLSFAVVMGVFFLLLFNYVFGGAIGAGADVDYIQFLVPGILVDAPAYGGEPGNPARITGVAAAFEAVFQVAITDRDGLILNETFVMTDNGMGWGTFDALITYEVDEPQWGSLIVWENSANDGSQINVREYPVWLTPSS